MNKDLTIGSPRAALWRFSLPLFGSILFQQLYNIADSLVAGKFIGEEALAAVGNSYEVTLIFIAFAFGCNIGCSVVVSRLFGAKDWRGMKAAVSTTFIASGALCLVLMGAGFLLCPALLRLILTPAEIFEDCMLYLRIYVAGLPFLFFYNISTGIFSAMGDSKTPFLFLAASSTANIAVDVLFVKGLGMAVDGVAWATFLCQGVSCLLAVTAVLRRLRTVPHAGKAARFSPALFREIAVVAVPSILQQSFISVGNIVLQGIINSYGSGVMAGYSAAVKLNNMVITAFTTLGNGMSNFVAQNIGAGKKERVRQGFWAGLEMVYLLCVPILALYLLCGEPLIRLFIEAPSQDALHAGTAFLRIVTPFYLVVSTKLIADGVLRGAGAMRRFMAATFSDLILRVTLAYVFSALFAWGSTGIWCAWPVGWSIGTVLSVIFYRRGSWHEGSPAEHVSVR